MTPEQKAGAKKAKNAKKQKQLSHAEKTLNPNAPARGEAISKSGEAVTVEDMGSTNGTFVNGQRVGGPTRLYHGDAVQFGAVQCRYEE